MLKFKISKYKYSYFLYILLLCMYATIKQKYSIYNIGKFERSHMIFHEIMEILIFRALQITTKTNSGCFDKLGPVFSHDKVQLTFLYSWKKLRLLSDIILLGVYCTFLRYA